MDKSKIDPVDYAQKILEGVCPNCDVEYPDHTLDCLLSGFDNMNPERRFAHLKAKIVTNSFQDALSKVAQQKSQGPDKDV